MSFTAKVKDGVVVLPAEAKLPDGAEVTVSLCGDDPLAQAILKLARPRPEWPPDFAQNHGHYVSGEPKKP